MINTNTINNEDLSKELVNKKVGVYTYDKTEDNFALEGEITVTITLAEYRKLIKEVATKEYDIKKVEADKYERNCKMNALEEENAKLKQKLFAYVDAFGKLEEDETYA